MDLSASFNLAVKHLFRHLREPRALRANPLVRRFFDDPATAGLGRARDNAVLGRIHDLVRQGAEHCRDADLTAGKGERALRQHTIVLLLLLEQRGMREIATKLGISYGYCYRERAEICRRIACYICEHADAVKLDCVVEFDEFRFLLDRALRRAAFGDMQAAFDECDGLIRVASSKYQKVEALRTSALVSISCGNVKRAEDTYAAAQNLFEGQLSVGPSPSQNVAQACVDLMGSELAYYRANAGQALRLVQRATSRLQAVQANAEPSVRELYVESLYELGTAFCNSNDLDSAYDCLASAEANLCDVRTASPRLRTRIMVAVWKLRNHLLMNSKMWRPSWQRVKGLTAAFEQAYAAGLLFEAADALDALTEYHAFAGNHEESLHAAHSAALIAKQQPNERMRAQVSIRVAMTLLSTRYWEYAQSLIPSAEELVFCDAYHREMVSHFAAERAFRLRNFRDAWTLSTCEEDRRENATLTLSRRIVAAAAAHELERRGDARALIEAAIPEAEQSGSAPILRDAYRVAARITGDIHFKRQASEVVRLLRA
jgi:hypothetical protein